MTDKPKLPAIEACIAWAAQQGYSYADNAADELSSVTGRIMVESHPLYNVYKWIDCKAKACGAPVYHHPDGPDGPDGGVAGYCTELRGHKGPHLY